jgi:beta-lactamase regulating signal transducer with metallopeptidase domain
MAVNAPFPETAIDTVLILAAGTAMIAAAGHLAAQWLRPPAWQRAVWQMVLLAVAGLAVAELAGLSSCVAHLVATRHVAQGARVQGDEQASRVPHDVAPHGASVAVAPDAAERSDGLRTETPPSVAPTETGMPLPIEGPAPSYAATISLVPGSISEQAPSAVEAIAGGTPPSPRRVANDVRSTTWRGAIGRWFIVIWLAGAVFLALLRAGVGSLLLWRSARRLRPLADDALVWSAYLVSRRLGMRRTVRLREAAGLSAPMAWGIARPTIALPPGFADDYGPAEQQAMLAHELAHLRGVDPLWQRLADWLTVVLWWHPAAWWTRRQWQAASERVADEASLVVDGGPELLAECLVQLGGRVSGARPLGSLGMRGGFRSHLGRRVERLLSLGHERWRPPGRLQWVKALIPVAAVAAAIFCTSWARSETSYEGEADMNMVQYYWRQSVLGVAVVATLSAADRAWAADPAASDAAVVAAQEDRPAEGERRDGDRPREEGKRDGDRPREGVKRDGDRPPPREGEKRDGERPKGERRDGDRPPPREGERREGDRPRPGDDADLDRQLRHLSAAADNLEAAGRREEAERIRREIAERSRRGAGERPGFPPGKAEGGPGRPAFAGGPPELMGMIRQLQEELAQLRREMAEMRRMMGREGPGDAKRPEGRPGEGRPDVRPEGPPKPKFRRPGGADAPRKDRDEPRRKGREEGEEGAETAPAPAERD